MKNSKVTKRALFSSVMSSSLCVSMLIGTTFAWFTDTVSTGVNTIQTGNLDVTLEYYNGEGNPNDNQWIKVTENDPLFNSNKWEPGHMVVQGLRVGNAGNLSLNWKATLGTKTGISRLGDVIDVYVKPGEYSKPEKREHVTDKQHGWTHAGTLTHFVSTLEETTKGSLMPEQTAELGIALVMQTTADNDYQNLSLGGNLGLTILATQYTGESDSFGTDYDANALFIPEADAVYYVTPETAQTTIDNAVDNSVVILQKGDYSKLQLGKVKRTINNLTIIAENDVTVQGMEAETAGGFLTINNLTLKNINFIKSGVFFDLNYNKNWIFVNGFTMTDCSYDGETYDSDYGYDNAPGNRLFDIGTDSPSNNRFKNVLIENCTVKNAKQGIRIGSVIDITVRKCTFDNINHNAITLRSVGGGINRIEDNTINKGFDRAFRVGANTGGTIIYKNNVITNTTGDPDDGSNFKVTTNTGDIQFIGNTVDGEKWDGN